MSDRIDTPWRGKFLEVKQQGAWEWAARANDIHAAVILAIDDGHVLLVEQRRVPLGRPTLELPAGLVGDETRGETVEAAAARELEEETGYRAGKVESLGAFASSPGMTSETFTLVRATGLTKVGEGGGEGDESIVVHRVLLDEVAAFVEMRRVDGCVADARLLLVMAAAILPKGMPE